MKIVIAPDAFKGSMSSMEVIETMEAVIREEIPDVHIEAVPIADGGEGTIEALMASSGGSILPKEVRDPLGRVVKSHYGVIGLTAVIEMANCSGLTMLNREELNPLLTSSYGTGQMIRYAIKDGFQSLVIGIGGSASNDGGTGALEALGVQFFDKSGRQLKAMCGKKLIDIDRIDTSEVDYRRISKCDISVMCDVNNPLTGPEGATYVYGPQKGASPEDLELLEAGMVHYRQVLERHFGKDIGALAGAGAAGGMGAALLGFLQGDLVSGIDQVLDLSRFQDKVEDADLIITGEGQVDGQSVSGKAICGITSIANAMGKPVVLIAGSLGQGWEAVYDLGVKAILTLPNRPMTLDNCLVESKALLEDTTRSLCRLITL